MAKSKKISLSKIIKKTEDEYKKSQEENIKRAYGDLLTLLENVHSAKRGTIGNRTVHIFSFVARPVDELISILRIINKYNIDNPRLNIKATYNDGGRLHYDVIIYRPSTNLSAIAVQFNKPEDSPLSDDELDNEYNALLDELRNRAK